MKPLLLAVLGLGFVTVIAGCEPPEPPPQTPTKPTKPHKPQPQGPEDGYDIDSLAPMTEVDKSLGSKPVARLHLIDVGQGAATLLEFSCGAVLIDTGGESGFGFESEPALKKYLDSFFTKRPDLDKTFALMVLTHPHLDHTRNVEMVAKEYKVKNVVTDGRETGSGGKQQKFLQDWAKTNAKLEAIDADKVPIGGLTSGVIDPVKCEDVDPSIRALWGGLEKKPDSWKDEDFANANNHSVVLRVDAGKATFMISGDLEMAGMESVMKKHGDTGILDIDVWEVSHHGARNGTMPPWVRALSPQIAVIGMGAVEREGQFTAWAFGHPRKDIVSMLEVSMPRTRRELPVKIGTAAKTFEPFVVHKAVYGTGWDGSVLVSASLDGKYRVQTRK